jgi:hypothetical protein
MNELKKQRPFAIDQDKQKVDETHYNLLSGLIR